MDEKQKILSDMYTLRAGLCWISQKKHEIDKLKTSVQVPEKLTEQDVLREANEKIDNTNQQLKEILLQSGELKSKRRNRGGKIGWFVIMAIFLTIIGLGGAYGFAYWGYSLILRDGFTTNGYWMPCFIVGAVLLLGGLFFYICTISGTRSYHTLIVLIISIVMLCATAILTYIGYDMLQQNKDIFWTSSVFAGGGLTLIAALVEMLFLPKYCVQDVKYSKKMKVLDAQITELENDLRKLREELANVKSDKLPQILQQNQDSIDEAKHKIADIRKYQIKPLIELCNKFFDTLTDTFGEELDVRDWAYIDLVIYYVETNRAVSIREALQLIDRERQTQQIVASLKTAAIAICNTIKTETRKLTASIEQGFNALQSKLDSMERSFNSQMSSLQSSVEYSAAQARMLSSAQISQTDLTNALLQQNNASSEQLINDVNYIRNRLL